MPWGRFWSHGRVRFERKVYGLCSIGSWSRPTRLPKVWSEGSLILLCLWHVWPIEMLHSTHSVVVRTWRHQILLILRGSLQRMTRILYFRKVTVGEHVTGGEELSPDLIRQVEGEIGLEETGLRLNPLSPDMSPDESLALASAQLIHDHLQSSNETLLLAQV